MAKSYELAREEGMKRNRYVDLRINGRLFPSWVLANFRKFHLPEIVKKADVDPCKKTDKQVVFELRKYQKFIGAYLDYKSIYRNVLVYHGLGSGKTGSAINVYNVLYNYTPGWNVFILLKASLRGNWLTEIKRWLRKDEYEYRFKNIIFIHYDSPFADRNFLDALKNIDNSKKSLYIIEEVHNFIRNVYSNISTRQGKRAQTIYDYIIQDKKENPDTRVALLSGTPAVNNPFELALLFNLLRPGSFPASENEFNHLFVTSGSYQTIKNKNLFQRRIMGLTSFYLGATPDRYATKKIYYQDIPMSEYQQDVYDYFEEIEEQIARRAKIRGGGQQTYKSYTRQSSNFVFPALSQRITGELRPRPNKFRISERDAMKMFEGRSKLKEQKGSDKLMNVAKYNDAMQSFVKAFDNHLFEQDKQDRANKYTIFDDFKKFQQKYEANFNEFHAKEKVKSNLYKAMHLSSAKMTNIIFNILNSKGPTQVYSNYVLMEGIEIFKIYLKYFGFYNYMIDKKLRAGQVGYVEFHGGIKDIQERYEGMKVYNSPENKYGEKIKIILISPAGSEGLSLKNVRQVHIMEPYWNEVRITQMIGRAVRQCSHADLKMEERHVDIYRYRSIRGPDAKLKGKITTDQYIEELARTKDSLIQGFLNAVKEVAIDCVLFKNHNKLEQDIKCFQFNEPSLFDDYIGPAYRDNIKDDIKYANGSNAPNTMRVKIKVMKITAVKQLTPTDPEETIKMEYSQPEFYWYYSKSSVVYDYELKYPIGKIALDEFGNAKKLDKDTYIIDKLVPIPLIQD